MDTNTTPDEVQKLEPCEDMKDYISALADGSLSGIYALFTRLHLQHCTKCRNALAGFIALRAMLLKLNTKEPVSKSQDVISYDNRSRLQNSLDALDRNELP